LIPKALLVIDMQKDLCYDIRRRGKVEKMIVPLRHAIDLFASAGCLVYYVCLALSPDAEQFRRFGDKYCIEGTEGTEIIPELFPLRGKVIKKKKHSAFFGTELDQYLRESNVREVYLSGLQTQICIMTTAADASFRGYRTIAISDCVLSTREKSKKDALLWIERYVGEVIPLAEVAKGFGYD
jgi:nicotinamidase/pyrazinamidase